MLPWRANIWDAPISPKFLPGKVNAFCREHLNPYVNFHRPCFFPRKVIVYGK